MRSYQFIFLIMFLWGFSASSYACEPTKEYSQLRTEVYKAANDAYLKCTSAVSSAQYWFTFSQCFKAGDGKNVGGGCGHIAQYTGNKYKTLPIDREFCKILKPESKEMSAALSEEVKEKGIKKCK